MPVSLRLRTSSFPLDMFSFLAPVQKIFATIITNQTDKLAFSSGSLWCKYICLHITQTHACTHTRISWIGTFTFLLFGIRNYNSIIWNYKLYFYYLKLKTNLSLVRTSDIFNAGLTDMTYIWNDRLFVTVLRRAHAALTHLHVLVVSSRRCAVLAIHTNRYGFSRCT